MQKINGDWVISAQDLVSEYSCTHKLALDAAAVEGNLARAAEDDRSLELLRQRGLAHEAMLLARCEDSGEIARLDQDPSSASRDWAGATAATLAAMEMEIPTIYQATLFTGDFVGIADFLILATDERGNVLRDKRGLAVYEPVDAKSARRAKTSAVLQVAAYADALIRLGRPAPVNLHLWLAGDQAWSAPAANYLPLAREYRTRVLARIPSLGQLPQPAWAAPVSACAHCPWKSACAGGRVEGRDLSLVQGMNAKTRGALSAAGVDTIDKLAGALDKPHGASQGMFDKLRAQAQLQIRAEEAGRVLVDVVDPAPISALPAASSGDLWLDFEGDPYANNGHGLEYMIGYGYRESDGSFGYTSIEAHDMESERRAFEAFIDIVLARLSEDPGMHVYHYAEYERSALTRLSQRYSTRESELDLILSSGVLVDLYRVVKKSLRVSTSGLSLKSIEAAYGISHNGESVSSAMDSVVEYERATELRESGQVSAAEQVLADIRAYNRLDCESTWKLDEWLRALAPAGQGVHIQASIETNVPTDSLIESLMFAVPADESERTPQQRERALLAGILGYHKREERVAWWNFFDAVKTDEDELPTSSKAVHVSGARADEWEKPTGRQRKSRREMTLMCDSQDPRDIFKGASSVHAVYADAPVGTNVISDSPRGTNRLSIVSVNENSVTVLELSESGWHETPIALVPDASVSAKAIEEALREAAYEIAPTGAGNAWHFGNRAWVDLLLARTPRAAVREDEEDTVSQVLGAVESLDNSYWAVQGPPGTGKTYVGSRVVAALAKKGWKIGVVAQSHAVVENFLEKVREVDADVAVAKTPSAKDKDRTPLDFHISGKVCDWARVRTGGYVIGGTAWTFSDANMSEMDLLVIDEAGQFALANAAACALKARNVLLLGDPQQLPQVSQAAHPEGVETAVLEHVMRGEAVIDANRGTFLAHTRRMHPALTRRVSALSYEGKLGSHESTSERNLEGIEAGVHAVEVSHQGNTTRSLEEAVRVREIVQDTLGKAWFDGQDTRALDEGDIIVVAAYNAQVGAISRELKTAGLERVNVGTVDRFQGREAAIAIVSMAASSSDELPRGLEFLLMANRLNVAVSRAQWASYVIFSPELLTSNPGTLEGMAQLGGFLGLLGH